MGASGLAGDFRQADRGRCLDPVTLLCVTRNLLFFFIKTS
jgi:hypothetical protein